MCSITAKTTISARRDASINSRPRPRIMSSRSPPHQLHMPYQNLTTSTLARYTQWCLLLGLVHALCVARYWSRWCLENRWNLNQSSSVRPRLRSYLPLHQKKSLRSLLYGFRFTSSGLRGRCNAEAQSFYSDPKLLGSKLPLMSRA